MNKVQTLEKIRAGYTRLNQSLTGLDEAALLKPGVEGEWSVKDLLHHLNFWQKVLLSDLQPLLRVKSGQPLVSTIEESWPDPENQANAREGGKKKAEPGPLQSGAAENPAPFRSETGSVPGEERLVSPAEESWPDPLNRANARRGEAVSQTGSAAQGEGASGTGSAAQGEGASGTASGESPEDQMHRLNAENFRAGLHLPLDEVKNEFERLYREVLAAVERLSDEDLKSASPLVRKGKVVLEGLIAGNSYDHFKEHLETVQSWRDKAGV